MYEGWLEPCDAVDETLLMRRNTIEEPQVPCGGVNAKLLTSKRARKREQVKGPSSSSEERWWLSSDIQRNGACSNASSTAAPPCVGSLFGLHSSRFPLCAVQTPLEWLHPLEKVFCTDYSFQGRRRKRSYEFRVFCSLALYSWTFSLLPSEQGTT